MNQDSNLEELKEEPYETESFLQELLEKNPNLLSGVQIDPVSPRRWLLVKREARLPMDDSSGRSLFLDHLILDQDAIPTLVEVKRSSDTRIRREVVGQMLDYAANAVAYLPIESLISQFEEQCRKADFSAEEVLTEFLDGSEDASDFWERVKTNLQAGRIRMLFVADEIPPELRSIVEFLNQQMDPAIVLAVEIKQYVGNNLRTLVPVVIGQTSEAQQRKGSTRRRTRQWDEESFFELLSSKSSEEEVTVTRKILEWAKTNSLRITWGSGAVDGSFVPVFDIAGESYPLFAAYTYGSVEVYFQYLRKRAPFDNREKRLCLLDKINKAPNVSFSIDSIERRPRFTLEELLIPETMRVFLEAYEWVISEILDSCNPD